jgi:cation diffusion facilitator family transporter
MKRGRKSDLVRSAKKVVYAATAVNLAITVCKYVAAIVTGSSAMLAEAIHSTVDTGNELLLLLGMKRSLRPPDALHPFGHGKTVYFYSLLVAVYIFLIGGGLTIYEGVSRLRSPSLPTHVMTNYCVLATAAVFESYSWWLSHRELRRRAGANESVWNEIIASKDPAVFTVFLEDSAALIGLAVAFLGIALGRRFGNPYLDPIASIVIGALLAAVAVLLGRESGALLLGERTRTSTIRRVREILKADPAVEDVGDLLTMQLGPDQVLLAVNIRFRRGIEVAQLESAVDRIESTIRNEEPVIQRIFIEADSLKPVSKRRGKVA